MKHIIAAFCFFLFTGSNLFSQTYTLADTLRGSNGPGRAWWNATRYDLHVKLNIKDQSISGYNIISFSPLNNDHPGFFQIDLQEPMLIDSVIYRSNPKGGKSVSRSLLYERMGNAWFVFLDKKDESSFNPVSGNLKTRQTTIDGPGELWVYFHGKPKVAQNAPWDGGIIWQKDKAGNPWVTVACQGLGASVWYPCKDWQGDEPDSAALHVTAPSDLVSVSNGRLRDMVKNNDGTTTYTWAVVSPINSYNLIPYTGKYVHFGEIYKGEKGDLTMDYWVLDSNLEKAKMQFQDAPRMMKAFEYWFGPYPFYADGYKLVEAPHLGMEHQSAVAYGNGFQNGYRGRDLSGTGHGLTFDFIIIHESGHEWFGNNITTKDIADMWVHEGFTNYSEALFVEYYYGKKAGSEYVIGVRKNIRNDIPVQGVYGVQKSGSGDMYYKGANMIHTIRQVVNDDNVFRNMLRSMNSDFYHQTVTGKQIERYINEKTGIDFSKVFDQYLRTVQIPVLEYRKVNNRLEFRWNNCVPGFNMPVKIKKDSGEYVFVKPGTSFSAVPAGISTVVADENFYITVKEVNP